MLGAEVTREGPRLSFLCGMSHLEVYAKPERPDCIAALPASPATWSAMDERGKRNVGSVNGST
jgi:hypothetical protein